jgi:hypothetical protein
MRQLYLPGFYYDDYSRLWPWHPITGRGLKKGMKVKTKSLSIAEGELLERMTYGTRREGFVEGMDQYGDLVSEIRTVYPSAVYGTPPGRVLIVTLHGMPWRWLPCWLEPA